MSVRKIKILKFIFYSIVFSLLTCTFIIEYFDFNIQLIFMIFLIFLTYYMVIEFKIIGVYFVTLIYSCGIISIAITESFKQYHLNAVMAFQLSIIISIFYLYSHVKKVEVAREKMYNAAIIDELTGIYNKRYFNIKINEQYESAKRNRTKFSIIIIDLDRFKFINDFHGHLFGDEILKSFAKEVSNKIRLNDTFFRFGGDEFIILTNCADEMSFQIFKNRIQLSVDTLNKKYPEELQNPFSVSVGMAIFPDDAPTINKLVMRADQAMYKAKTFNNTSFIQYKYIKDSN